MLYSWSPLLIVKKNCKNVGELLNIDNSKFSQNIAVLKKNHPQGSFHGRLNF